MLPAGTYMTDLHELPQLIRTWDASMVTPGSLAARSPAAAAAPVCVYGRAMRAEIGRSQLPVDPA